MNKYTKEIYEYLLRAVLLAYRDGKENSLSLKKPTKYLRFAEPPKPNFAFNEIDKSVLSHFRKECFQVASVGSYELEEKLKSLAIKVKTENVPDPYKTFKEGAFRLITQYVPSDKWPHGAWLETNLRTAMRSSFYAAQYSKLQDPDMLNVYPAYQYKTQEDARVRDEHARLNNRVYLATDPIWKQIWPPNGWNCRCYVVEVDQTELKDYEKKNGKVTPSTQTTREADINDAKVPQEFRRNAAEESSIWGKWLSQRLAELPPEIQKEIDNFTKNIGLKADSYTFEDKSNQPVTKEIINITGNKIKISDKEFELKDYELKVLKQDNVEIYTGKANNYNHNHKTITVNPTSPENLFHEVGHRIDQRLSTGYINNDLRKETDFQNLYKTKKTQVLEILRHRVLPDVGIANRQFLKSANTKDLSELFNSKKPGFFKKQYINYIRQSSEIFAEGYMQFRTNPEVFKKYAVDFYNYFSEIKKKIK